MGFRDGLESRWRRGREAFDQAATAGQSLVRAARSGIACGVAKLEPGGEWMRTIVETYPQPRLPLEQDWEVSISALVGQVPKVPAVAVKLLRLLNRFGAVRLGVDKVGLDGDDIAWSKVTEIRTHRLADMTTESLLEAEIERLSSQLPPVPGRRWVVTRVGELLLTLAQMRAGGTDSEPEESAAEGEDPRVPVEIVYSGMVRKEIQHKAGLAAVLLLAAMPEANHALVTLADQHGIPVVPSQEKSTWQTAGERAEAMRATLASLRSRFARKADELDETAPEQTAPDETE